MAHLLGIEMDILLDDFEVGEKVVLWVAYLVLMLAGK
jgi:hypothetical protein